MAVRFLDFEQPIAELEAKIEELKHVTSDSAVNIQDEIARLQAQEPAADHEHLRQPHALADHAARAPSAAALHARLRHAHLHRLPRAARRSHVCRRPGHRRRPGAARRPAGMLIGHQKGRDTKERVRRNYGMPKPEGYRKALRLMRLAERFGLPLITLSTRRAPIPGVGAEERGQSEAIARNLFEMSALACRSSAS